MWVIWKVRVLDVQRIIIESIALNKQTTHIDKWLCKCQVNKWKLQHTTHGAGVFFLSKLPKINAKLN